MTPTSTATSQNYITAIPQANPQDSIMMQAIVAIANNQYQSGTKIEILENNSEILKTAVENLSEHIENNIPTKEDVKGIVKDCMQINPEDIMLANTMGYCYEKPIDIMSIEEIRKRLGRIQRMYGRNCAPSWVQRMFKYIGKSRKEIKFEAQAKAMSENRLISNITLCKAVEEIPEYLKWGTAILLEIERENSIYCKPYSRLELFRSGLMEFNERYIEEMDKTSFEAWLQRRFHDCADMCQVDEKKARDILYNALRLHIEKHQFNGRNCIMLSDLSGDVKKDIANMCNEKGKFKEVKDIFIFIIKECLVI